MKSRISYFNAAIFKKTVLRFWPLWAAYLAVWLLALTFPIVTDLSFNAEHGFAHDVDIEDIWRHCLGIVQVVGLLISGVTAVLAAMASWSFAYNSRSASGYAQLPVRREEMFSSLTLAGLLPALALNLLVALLTLLAEAAYGAAHFVSAAQWFAAVSLIYIFFYGLATLCAQLTGNILVLPAVYVVLNFTAYVVMALVYYIVDSIMYGINMSGDSLFVWLSPAVAMGTHISYRNTIAVEPGTGKEWSTIPLIFEGWGIIIAYAVVGLALIALALLVYRRRRMETAGDVVAVNVLKPVFKYCMTGGCALVLGVMLHSMFSLVYDGSDNFIVAAELLVFMLIGAVIGYYASEMLMKKSFRVFRGSLRGIAVSCLVIIALMLGCEFDLFGVERRVPDADEVKSVYISSSGVPFTLEERQSIEDAIVLHESIVENKSVHEAMVWNTGTYYAVSIRYELSDGGVMNRYYRFGGSEAHEDVYALQELANCDEAVAERMSTDIPATRDTVVAGHIEVFDPVEGVYNAYEFRAEDAYELYSECIVPDIADGGLGRVWIVDNDETYNSTVCDARIYIELYDFEGVVMNEDYVKHNESFSVAVTTDAVRTMSWLRSRGIEPVTYLWSEEYYGRPSAYDEPYVYEYSTDVPVPAGTQVTLPQEDAGFDRLLALLTRVTSFEEGTEGSSYRAAALTAWLLDWAETSYLDGVQLLEVIQGYYGALSEESQSLFARNAGTLMEYAGPIVEGDEQALARLERAGVPRPAGSYTPERADWLWSAILSVFPA